MGMQPEPKPEPEDRWHEANADGRRQWFALAIEARREARGETEPRYRRQARSATGGWRSQEANGQIEANVRIAKRAARRCAGRGEARLLCGTEARPEGPQGTEQGPDVRFHRQAVYHEAGAQDGRDGRSVPAGPATRAEEGSEPRTQPSPNRTPPPPPAATRKPPNPREAGAEPRNRKPTPRPGDAKPQQMPPSAREQTDAKDGRFRDRTATKHRQARRPI